MVDKNRDSEPSIPRIETPEGQDNQVQTVNTTQTVESSEILDGFGLERLFDESHKAFYDVRSEDTEMGFEKHSWSREKDVSHIPEVLRGMPEVEKVFEFIRKPSTDLTQIRQRQSLITSLLEFEGLDRAIELKNDCYKVTSGIKDYIFGLVAVSDYHNEPALYAYRHGREDISRDMVFKGISQVEEGKRAMTELVSLLSASNNPLILAIAEEYRSLRESIDCLSEQFFLEADYQEVEEKSRISARKSEDLVMKGGVFLEFSRLAKTDSYSPASFNTSQPRGYKKGWNFVRRKASDEECQVLNDSPDEHEVTVYAGSNMSGKSFSGLKKEFFMQCLAQSFGYVPCEGEANFPTLHDSFHYLDRASTEHFSNLSAFGSEVKNWNHLTPNLGERAFVCVDEGWSTTSAEDQYKLLRAGAVLYLPSKGARVFLASHNEHFLNEHTDQNNLGIYHFRTQVDAESGTPAYHYELMPGMDDSNALAVARGLGLPEDIICTAQKYLDGEAIKVDCVAKPQFREIVAYSEAEREAMKKQGIGENPSIPIGQFDQDSRLLTTLSADKDFRWGLRLGASNFLSGSPHGQDIHLGGWSPHNVGYRDGFVNGLVLGGPALSSQEALERRRTFELLAADDKFEEMLEVEEKLLFLIKFLPYLRHGHLLRFNLSINPFTDRDFSMDDYWSDKVELVLAYLEMNRKLIGDDFPLAEQLEGIKSAKAMVERAVAVVDGRDVNDVIALLEADQREIIEDPEMLALFASVAKDDEPNPEQWGGVITRERIIRYYRHIQDKDWEKSWDDKNFKKLWAVAEGHYSGHLVDTVEGLQKGRATFLKIAQEFEEGFDESKKVSRGRVGVLMRRIFSMLEKEPHGTERHSRLDEAHSELRDLHSTLWRLQSELGLTDEEMGEQLKGRLTPDSAIRDMLDRMSICRKADKVLPPLKAFEHDLSQVHEEIKLLVGYLKKKNKKADLEYYNYWGEDLTFAFVLELLSDKRDFPAELLGTLRGYDSVHTHQMANSIEGAITDYVQIGEWRYSHRRWDMYYGEEEGGGLERKQKEWEYLSKICANLCGEEGCQQISSDLRAGNTESYDELMGRLTLGSGPHLLSIFSDIYQNVAAQLDSQVSELECEKAVLLKQCPRAARRLDWSEGLKKLDSLLNLVDGNTRSTRKEDCLEAISTFFEIKHEKQDFDTRMEAIRPYRKAMDDAIRGEHMEVVRSFVSEVAGSEEIAEVRAFCEGIRRIAERAEPLARANGVFESDERAHREKSIRSGSLYYLRKAVDSKYGRACDEVLGFAYDRDKQASLNSQIGCAIGLFKIGNMIRAQKMQPVSYNASGEIHLPKVWSLFASKNGQVRNDVSLRGGKLSKLLGSSNMSGKTFWEKGAISALLWGSATGHAPSDTGATMPLLDGVLYFDRVTSRSDKSLSAYGEEIKRAVAWLEKAQAGKVVVSMSDEFGSSTSPRYQSALYYAMVTEMLRRGQYTGFASHSHDATDALNQVHGEHLEVMHFAHHKEDGDNGRPKVVFDYALSSEREDSEAIDVAEMLELNEEIIRFARLI